MVVTFSQVVRRLESDLWGDHRCCLKRAELWCVAWQAGDHGEAGKGPPGAAMVGSMGTKGTDWWCTMGQL
ncbi:hypothetical protein V6N13_054079 [Hibiscus sabdariffa]